MLSDLYPRRASWGTEGKQLVQGHTAEPGCEHSLSVSREPLAILLRSLLHFLVCQMGTIMPISLGYCRGKHRQKKRKCSENKQPLQMGIIFVAVTYRQPPGLRRALPSPGFLPTNSSGGEPVFTLSGANKASPLPSHLPRPGRSVAHAVFSLVAGRTQNLEFGLSRLKRWGHRFSPPNLFLKYFHL